MVKPSGHIPVLVKEVIEYLNIKPGAKIIDATVSGGGHTKAILEKYPDAKILGIELDPIIFENLKTKNLGQNIILVKDSYINLKTIARENNFDSDGILFDLGLSSWHYEESGRGFSFKRNEILDMRFDPRLNIKDQKLKLQIKNQNLTTAEIINTRSEEEIEEILKSYGEERFAKSIAKNIIRRRKEKPIIMTGELVRVIEESVPEWYKHQKIHFATKTFQALRVAVNDELGNVRKGIEAAIEILKPGGRLVVISFQGLEDKIVKEIFKMKSKEGIIKLVVKGTIKPSWEEVKQNPRARSAKMKVAEKI